MKYCSLFTLLSCIAFLGKSQFTLDTNSCLPSFNPAYIDSTYTFCDTFPIGTFNINIEATANNLWQIGKTYKFGSSSIRDTSCSITTDTLNPYSINNNSAFYFKLPKVISWSNFTNYYVSFWHKYETDSLKDGCWLEFSDDNGAHWHIADSFKNSFSNDFHNGMTCCNFYNIHSSLGMIDSLEDGTRAWSGSSNGWKYVSLWLNRILPLKPGRLNAINAIRFVFQSDSINTNKAGWIIDDINIGFVDVGSAVNDYTKNQFSLHPNPTKGEFTIELPITGTKFNIEVYNSIGVLVYENSSVKKSNIINLNRLADGLYFVKIMSDGKLIDTQKLLKN